MAQAKTAVKHKPIWLDLSSSDAAGSRDFYSKVFGWKIDVNPDPQYGGYAMATIGGKDVAGIGPKMSAEAPTAWTLYVATPDAADTAKKAKAAGGNVLVEPMQVGPQGTMAIIQDPTGAALGVWQPDAMAGTLLTGEADAFGWAELSSRGVKKARDFYAKVFGWGEKQVDMGGGMEYTEFQLDGQSIAGGMEMDPMVPAEMPSYWMAYFTVADVDASYKKAIDSGAHEIVAPKDFAGGRFAIVTDPQGAAFGLLKMRG